MLDAVDRIEIGRDCLIGPHCYIGDHDRDVQPGQPLVESRMVGESIWIGDNVFVGAGTVIKKGVTIGDGAVIGAGAVVTSDVEAGERSPASPHVAWTAPRSPAKQRNRLASRPKVRIFWPGIQVDKGHGPASP